MTLEHIVGIIALSAIMSFVLLYACYPHFNFKPDTPIPHYLYYQQSLSCFASTACYFISVAFGLVIYGTLYKQLLYDKFSSSIFYDNGCFTLLIIILISIISNTIYFTVSRFLDNTVELLDIEKSLIWIITGFLFFVYCLYMKNNDYALMYLMLILTQLFPIPPSVNRIKNIVYEFKNISRNNFYFILYYPLFFYFSIRYQTHFEGIACIIGFYFGIYSFYFYKLNKGNITMR